ncbi:acetyl-coenzyme A carboxylase carboxyltransferase subunit alpha [Striga asiatica]|uniref:Acetyl-coenzyme A carboxylase carboxyltransferase subunit alpha n=1 Tax=Striga asiatica TaxID=4170 RepID=A0A5A7P2A0_STRAF|nr:acetyl-coenzyme A carboxylase carboxyltransferase subunit alpha [Striga asiatica]
MESSNTLRLRRRSSASSAASEIFRLGGWSPGSWCSRASRRICSAVIWISDGVLFFARPDMIITLPAIAGLGLATNVKNGPSSSSHNIPPVKFVLFRLNLLVLWSVLQGRTS